MATDKVIKITPEDNPNDFTNSEKIAEQERKEVLREIENPLVGVLFPRRNDNDIPSNTPGTLNECIQTVYMTDDEEYRLYIYVTGAGWKYTVLS